MIALLLNTSIQSELVEILGIISACLEGATSLFLVVMKIITIFRSKSISDKEKIEMFDSMNKSNKDGN